MAQQPENQDKNKGSMSGSGKFEYKPGMNQDASEINKRQQEKSGKRDEEKDDEGNRRDASTQNNWQSEP